MQALKLMYITTKLIIFILCAIMMMPFGFLNPRWFVEGINGYMERSLNEAVSIGAITQEQADDLMKDAF